MLNQYFKKQFEEHESSEPLFFMIEANEEAGIPEQRMFKFFLDDLSYYKEILEYVRHSYNEMYPVFKIIDVNAFTAVRKK